MDYISFRFYSSTGRFSIPHQPENWQVLSQSSWNLFEDRLTERVDALTEPVDSLVGHKSQSAGLCGALEEVFALYSWDRPAVNCLVTERLRTQQKFGNAVVVMTRLPADMVELAKFMGTPVKRRIPPVRELINSFTTKRVRSQCARELNIAIHFIDTEVEEVAGERGEMLKLFNRTLKEEFKGGVLPMS